MAYQYPAKRVWYSRFGLVNLYGTMFLWFMSSEIFLLTVYLSRTYVILWSRLIGKYFNEIILNIRVSWSEMHLKMSVEVWPCCMDLNIFTKFTFHRTVTNSLDLYEKFWKYNFSMRAWGIEKAHKPSHLHNLICKALNSIVIGIGRCPGTTKYSLFDVVMCYWTFHEICMIFASTVVHSLPILMMQWHFGIYAWHLISSDQCSTGRRYEDQMAFISTNSIF